MKQHDDKRGEAIERVATFLKVLDRVWPNHPDRILTTGAATCLLKSDLQELVSTPSHAPRKECCGLGFKAGVSECPGCPRASAASTTARSPDAWRYVNRSTGVETLTRQPPDRVHQIGLYTYEPLYFALSAIARSSDAQLEAVARTAARSARNMAIEDCATNEPAIGSFTREDAAKLVERKAKSLADEYCHGDGGPDGYTWTNKEAEWQAILLDELAEEFRNGS